jgi:4a-hydroxytetrahydrobiopterin dehydratase
MKDLGEQIATLKNWRVQGGKLQAEFKFSDFAHAFAFMTQVAELAEAANHHPDWSNTYNIVKIALLSHDAGQITQKDVDLARQIDKLY